MGAMKRFWITASATLLGALAFGTVGWVLSHDMQPASIMVLLGGISGASVCEALKAGGS